MMGLEAVIICVDNSEWMRNGDFIPTRLQSQQDAVNVVTRMKTRQNVENSVGLLSLADTAVRVTLTNDLNKIFKSLQNLEPKGKINFVTGIRIAHLALKHRQNKNQKMRIVAFIGSPMEAEEKELIKLAKRLKKEKVSVDIVNFGEEEINSTKLTTFIDTINGKEKTCHLVTAHPGPLLSDVLISSPILTDEEGAPLAPMGQGFEFGIDPTEDPELAMALRVSMEEQRQRQEEETRRVAQESLQHMEQDQVGGGEGGLVQAEMADLPYNPDLPTVTTEEISDVSALTEEEQLALALQMSLQQGGMEEELQPMDTNTTPTAQSTEPVTRKDDEGMEEEDEGGEEEAGLMQNKEFLQSVLSTLPGVNPEEALQNLEQMTQEEEEKEEEDKEDH